MRPSIPLIQEVKPYRLAKRCALKWNHYCNVTVMRKRHALRPNKANRK
jgi:hypothetical protein